jgi:uncharacterized protein YjiS (DUF1127 family)
MSAFREPHISSSRETGGGCQIHRQDCGRTQTFAGAGAMRPEAIAKSIYCKVLSWFRIRANLAKLNALDNRTLMDIGLNRNEFHAAADPATPFERGVTLHQAPTPCESLRSSSCPKPV